MRSSTLAILALAAAAPAASAAPYDLHGTSLAQTTHVYFIDVTAPLCSLSGVCAGCASGTVQDWVEATILAAQAWSDPFVTGADFRYVFGGFIAGSPVPPTYPANVSVVSLGTSCVGYPGGGVFQTCMFGDIPFDVSGNPASGCFDLQGSSVHQMGHALGLNHTTVPGASMYTQSPTALEWRTIEADDIAGVQAIYGALPPNKAVLDYTGTPFTGRTILLRLFNVAGVAWIGFDTDPGPSSVLGLPIELGFSTYFFAYPRFAPALIPISLPPTPVLAGLTVFSQALVFTSPGGVPAVQISNPVRISIPY